ncbi:hypothetical protein BaRGS_00000601 [Batillaria attramentaria]|uniref:Uncharacterized protein n=1 Tax=Batillaria attramentaria TaxID=370345 RepID=A0ABD0MAG2_9CAEN
MSPSPHARKSYSVKAYVFISSLFYPRSGQTTTDRNKLCDSSRVTSISQVHGLIGSLDGFPVASAHAPPFMFRFRPPVTSPLLSPYPRCLPLFLAPAREIALGYWCARGELCSFLALSLCLLALDPKSSKVSM